MNILHEHTVEQVADSVRLNDYLIEVLKEFIPSRKGIKKAILREQILVNGAPVSPAIFVEPGMVIQLIASEKFLPKPFELDLTIHYEDDQLAVVYKPAGILVSGNEYRTIQNALLYNLKPSVSSQALPFPKPVHRLDVATQGLLLIAKTYSAINALGAQFQKKEISKTYHALVIGKASESVIINDSIDGKEAETVFQCIRRIPSVRHGFFSLLSLSPITGRTHQLRIHCTAIGHPIVGDTLYGQGNTMFKGLFLCASGVSFYHPLTEKKIEIKIPLPHKFTYRMQKEEQMWKKNS